MRPCRRHAGLAGRHARFRSTIEVTPALPRSDSHLTYMIDIALTTEFAITAGGVR